MQSEDLFAPSAEGRVFVRRWPVEGSGRAPIVLLHDSLGSVAQWRDFPSKLAQATSREVIAYDRLGFGQSDPRDELPSPAFVREEASSSFAGVRDALQLQHFVLFGHSVGGAMALEIAAAEGARCVGVVSESAQAFVEPRTRTVIRDAKAAFASDAQMARLQRWHGDKARWVLEAWTEVWLDASFDDWSLRDCLPRVHCPVLAIHGDGDEYGSLAFPRTIADGVAGPARMVALQGCGHVPHREQEAVVFEIVTEFLATLD